jgi:hypothetical protein
MITMAVVMPVAVLDHDAIGECRPSEEKRGGGGSEQKLFHFADILQESRVARINR